MSLDFFIVLACSILGLLAHGSRHQSWLGWILRVIIGICFVSEAFSAMGTALADRGDNWTLNIQITSAVLTLLILWMPVRTVVSYVVSIIDRVVSGQVFVTIARKGEVMKSLLAERIFVPASMPHLVALWIFISTAAFLMASVDPTGMKIPALPIPLPVPLDQLFSYNGLGLVMLSLCGVGIVISRKPLEAITRLGWVKPSLRQVAMGIGLIFITFAYDYIWSLFTHQTPDLAGKLSGYNSGTFSAGGGAGSSLILALATGLCAGIGEETLIRGALQPVFGILPAAILHGLLHGQFSHAPIFIIQVAGWSTLMGITKRYTNTTTTIIGHAGFNFLTTFLFAFNPSD